MKKFLGDLDDQLAQLNEFRSELKSNKPFGALPETAEKQYAAFVVSHWNKEVYKFSTITIISCKPIIMALI